MKIIFEKADLLKAVNIAIKAVPSRTTMSIQECILIDASASEIHFIGNDMEIGIETVCDGQILERGIVAVDAKIFSELIRRLPEDQVMVYSDEKMTVYISCGKANFRIPGREPGEFNRLPYAEKEESLSISQFYLKEMIRQTIFSIAPSENNKLMTGELFEIRNNVLRVVSLDGHRIAIRRMQLAEKYNDRKIIIPGKTLIEISKIISGEMDQVVDIYFMENYVLFEFDRTILMSRLIDGEFFSIDQMLSGDYGTKITVNRKEFMESIERAALLVKEGDKKPIVMDIRENELHLSINSVLGAMDESMESLKTGKDIRIGFNPKFLLDAIRVIDDETIDLYMVNAKAPCFIRDEYENYIYLVLPVNIESR